MLDFIQTNPALIKWLASISLVMFFVTLAIVPWLVTRIPDDYFSGERRGETSLEIQHPLLRLAWLLLKNLLGYLLILFGLAMLVTPGQGLLTVVIGLIMVDYPMKYRLERWLIKRKNVLKAMNWLRLRAHKKLLKLL